MVTFESTAPSRNFRILKFLDGNPKLVSRAAGDDKREYALERS